MRTTVTEKGIIREINGKLILVAPDLSAICFGCTKTECKSGKKFINAENNKALPLKTGQMVEVQAPGFPLLKQAMTVILPPAFGFVKGFALVRLLLPGASEGAAAAMGAVCLFLAAFVVYAVRKKNPARQEFIVTRIIE